MPGIRHSGNQQARYRGERTGPLPAGHPPGVTRQEYRPDAGGPGPQEVSPEAVADEHSLSGAEASQLEGRLIDPRMRFPPSCLRGRNEDVDVCGEPGGFKILAEIPSPVRA